MPDTQTTNDLRAPIVAVDLDETLIDPKTETLMPPKNLGDIDPLQALLKLKQDGWKIIIWTARADAATHVPEILKRLGIPYDAINEDVNGVKDRSRKVFFDAVVDDKSVNPSRGWDAVLDELQKRRERWQAQKITKSDDKVRIVQMNPITGDVRESCIFGIDKSGKAVLLEGSEESIDKDLLSDCSRDNGVEFLKSLRDNINTSFCWAE